MLTFAIQLINDFLAKADENEDAEHAEFDARNDIASSIQTPYRETGGRRMDRFTSKQNDP